MENLGTVVLAVGALGTAAFGIIEAFKWTRLGLSGFSQIPSLLGQSVMSALDVAYGSESQSFLKAEYRCGRVKGGLSKAIRQGVRVGLTPDNAPALAEEIRVVDGKDLQTVASELQSGEDLKDEYRAILGKFELALDSRIDAALAIANERYVGSMRLYASIIAIIIALAVGIGANQDLLLSLVVGVAAVPIAPVAKDISKAIQAAGKALPGSK